MGATSTEAMRPDGGEDSVLCASLMTPFNTSLLIHFLTKKVIFQALHSWPELAQKAEVLLLQQEWLCSVRYSWPQVCRPHSQTWEK